MYRFLRRDLRRTYHTQDTCTHKTDLSSTSFLQGLNSITRPLCHPLLTEHHSLERTMISIKAKCTTQTMACTSIYFESCLTYPRSRVMSESSNAEKEHIETMESWVQLYTQLAMHVPQQYFNVSCSTLRSHTAKFEISPTKAPEVRHSGQPYKSPPSSPHNFISWLYFSLNGLQKSRKARMSG